MTRPLFPRTRVTQTELTLLLLLSSLLPGLLPTAAADTGDGTPADTNIVYVGRWDKTVANVYRSYWSGAYFRVNFTGTSVQLRLAAATHLHFSIDGRADVDLPSANGLVNLTPTPLAPGVHTLRVSAHSEFDVVQFQGLVLDASATTLAPEARVHHIEFIGDSITAGCCALSEWALSDYAWRVGEILNAEHTQIAYSGICLQNGIKCSSPNSLGMSQQYFKLQTVDYPASPAWDFRYQPDAVVINLGTNDHNFGVTDATFQATYTTFLQNLRARYPNAYLFAVRPFGGFKASATVAAVNARIAAGDTRLSYVDTTGWVTVGTTDYSPNDTLHPSDSGHVKIANRLAPFIAKTARWDVPFADDFTDGNANGWLTYGGAWSASSGKLTVAPDLGGKALASGPQFSNFTYDADVAPGTTGNAGLVFRVSRPSIGPDAYQGYYAGINANTVALGRANGTWTLLSSVAIPTSTNPRHIRVVAMGPALKIYVDDMVTPRISVTDATFVSGAVGVRTFEAQATFDNLTVRAPTRLESSIQGYFVRHQESRGKISNFLSPAEDAEWRVVPGLANASAISLESVNYPGYFLRHRDGQIWMDLNNGTALFKADATWWKRPGQADSTRLSFEAYNFPGSFMRHRDGLLFSGPLSTALDRSDATFREY
jgi:lysophospholipase L1-like esterase